MDRRKLLSLMVALFTIVSVPGFTNGKRKPKERTIVPAWRIQLVDEAGNPVKNVFVRQVWQDYDVDDSDHEEDAHSDQDGYVSFPERRGKSVTRKSQEKIEEYARAWCSRRLWSARLYSGLGRNTWM